MDKDVKHQLNDTEIYFLMNLVANGLDSQLEALKEALPEDPINSDAHIADVKIAEDLLEWKTKTLAIAHFCYHKTEDRELREGIKRFIDNVERNVTIKPLPESRFYAASKADAN